MSDNTRHRGGTLREVFDYGFSPLNPMTPSHVDPPFCAIYETLVGTDPEGNVVPMLAESWDVSSDQLVWRFKVRDDARFHSGDPCDAEAIVTAYNRKLAEGVIGLIPWEPIKEVRADAGNIVVIELNHPCLQLPTLLRSWHIAIHNEATRQQAGESFGTEVADGTGPFTLTEFDADRIRVTRWDAYPGTGMPWLENNGTAYLDGIEWLSVSSPTERTRLLVEGDVDCVQNPAPADVDELRRRDGFTVVEFQQRSNIHLALNFEHTELGFNDTRVRQALSHAIDRERLVQEAAAGHGDATYGLLGSAFRYYESDVEDYNQYEPALAAALLDDAGWTRQGGGIREQGGVPLRFEVIGHDDPLPRRTLELVANMLREIGVAVTPRYETPFGPFVSAIAEGVPAFLSKWLWADPFAGVQAFTASWARPGPNWQQASIPELDDAYRDWWSATSTRELADAASRAQLAAAEHLPLIPLFTPNTIWVCTNRIHGWKPTETNLYPFYQDVWKEPS